MSSNSAASSPAQQVLLHACCGPCTAGTLPFLLEEGVRPVLYWNNPNIHPFTEYASRLTALREFARKECVPLIVDGSYGVRAFTAATAAAPNARCAVCYRMRMNAAARHAAESGYDAFTTTLLVSPFQDRDAILEAGQNAARKYGIPFLDLDFRPGFLKGQTKARDMGLYMQKYCGCIYSEEERYASRAAKVPYGYHPNFPKAEPHKQKARKTR